MAKCFTDLKLSNSNHANLQDLATRLFWRLISPLPDKPYVSLKYWSLFGKLPDLQNPRTYTEKIQVRKLYDRDERYCTLVDKERVKSHVAKAIGEDYVVPTYWCGTDLSEVDWTRIPLPAVAKPTHASGLLKFLRSHIDIGDLIAEQPDKSWLKTNHARYNREWAYEQVKPRILIEQMLEEGHSIFRFLVFNGTVGMIEVDYLLDGKMYNAVYDPFWVPISLRDSLCDALPGDLPRPVMLDQMKEVATELGTGFDFVRVDLYTGDNWIKFSELTFYPCGGYERFDPPEYDLLLGELWDAANHSQVVKVSQKITAILGTGLADISPQETETHETILPDWLGQKQ